MTDQLILLPSDALLDAWIEVLDRRLRDELVHAAPGHCVRVSDLPRPILEGLARSLNDRPVHGTEVYFVDRVAGPERWRAVIHRVVERRNAEERAVVALFPPDVQLAAGDSVDVSTFRVIPITDLPMRVEQLLLERMPSSLRARAEEILKDLKQRGWSLTTTARLTYLATVGWQQREEQWVLGAALFAVGLIPDYGLLKNPAEFHYRLGQRNIPIVERLQSVGATQFERILGLPVTDTAFRDQLIEFFQGRHVEQVTEWGAIIASDPRWRDLALERWPLQEESRPEPGSLRIDVEPLKLPRREDDGLLYLDASSKVTVAWQTAPAPMDVPDLAYFRVELLSSDRVVAWESPLIKNAGGKTAKRSRTIKGLEGLDTGIHFFRVIALDKNGDPFPEQPLRDPASGPDGKRVNETEDVLLVQPADTDSATAEDFAPIKNITVRGFAEAEARARTDSLRARKDPDTVRSYQVEWTTPRAAHGESAYASIRFDVRRQYTVRLSQRLRNLEEDSITRPDAGGRYRLRLGNRATEPEVLPLALPPGVAQTRRDVFEALRRQEVSGDGVRIVALADVCAIASTVEAYAREYQAWLDSGDPQALHMDVVQADLPEFGPVALVAPTHPVRLLWMLQHQQLGRSWTRDAWERGTGELPPIDLLQEGIADQGIPALLVLSPHEGYMDAGPLLGGWGAYLPPRLHDSRAALALLRARVGVGSAYQSVADIPPNTLADKFELFLRQHPYNQALVINVINAGDAAIVVDALIELERRRGREMPPVRYSVRIFSDVPQREGVGSAFIELLDPDRQISEAAATLLGSGESFLFPKLSWSRNALRDFVEKPDCYPAHITLLLDAFPVSLRVSRTAPADRSSFVHGLVQEAPRRFAGKGRAFAWIRRPAPTACVELPEGHERSALMADLLATIGTLQASVLAPNADAQDAVAVAALELTLANQSLIYSAHAASTWVLTLDPHLGVDYFDVPRQLDQPGYLLDFTPEFAPAGGRQLLLTTRIDDEVVGLMEPAASQLDLDVSGRHMLLETLRSLSGRLALRLLSAPTQVQGALGMALSRLFLEAYGLLDDSIVIPLDAHPELVARDLATGAPKLRGDLLVVSASPAERHLQFLIVEAKCYSGAGLGEDLREGITAQLRNSEVGLRERFDPDLRDPDRLDRVVQSWQLANVLAFYLDRAVRYGLVQGGAAEAMRSFFLDLDAGYALSTRTIGLVFRSGADSTYEDTSNPDLPIWVIGNDVTRKIVRAGLDRFKAHAVGSPDAPSAAPEPLEGHMPVMAEDDTWSRVRTTFGRGGSAAKSMGTVTYGPSAARTDLPDLREEPEQYPADSARSSGNQGLDGAAGRSEPYPGSMPTTSSGAHTGLVGYDVLLGEVHPTPQYGLVGAVASDPSKRVALDLNGCNTISVFGVQGSGKSYTVGSIIEMSTVRIPSLNVLPEPLGAVVFHFSQTQDYPPEFVSMSEPNDAARQALAAYGAAPQGLMDVLVLTTGDTLELRQREFPAADVQPIAFSSAELSVADWRFLMGATGNDALYLKLINEAMRQARSSLTLGTIRAAIARSPMSDAQRLLAETRLDFASRFIDDTRPLRSLLRPGRLIVVDLRDEFVEKEQALGLFVTMLNVFSGAGMTGDRFNKLIVFDEAHKYMEGTLSGQVIEVIREMRHRGVSVVIASQDPVNVPAAVIELSSTVILHRFNSPNWIRHIQRSLAALGDLTPQLFAGLGPGEAYVWANKATDPLFTRRPVKIRMRARASKHGGSTRTAVE